MALYCSKKLLGLLTGITSKNNRDFYCLNWLHSFRTKNKLESREKLVENKDFCSVVMPFEDSEILTFNQYQNFDKVPFIIYTDLESLTKIWMDVKIILKNHVQ